MIDPLRITNYDRTDAELEEFILFCIAVAGKNAKNTAEALGRFLPTGISPFTWIDSYFSFNLEPTLKRYGFGCYRARARSFAAIASSGLDLRTCTVQDLMRYPGIGPKTARFFVLHSRKDARVAVLDRHVLRWLARQGVAGVPANTPASAKQYTRLEAEFLRLCPPWNTAAQLDLEIWTEAQNAA